MSEDQQVVTQVAQSVSPTLSEVSQDLSKMRNSDIKFRQKYKASVAEIEDLKIQSQKEIQALKQSVAKEKETFQQKFIDAKLEAAAVAAGITDIDLVKLINKSGLTVDESGDLQGLSEAIQAFKEAKPSFFGTEKKVSSSSNAPLPSGDSVKKVNAKDLTQEEYNRLKQQVKAGKMV